MEMREDDGSMVMEGGRSSSSSISSRWVDDVCPGFVFNPTDEELLLNYLRIKMCGLPLPFGMDEVIPTIPLYGPRGDGDPRTLFHRLPSYCNPNPLVQTPTELYLFTNWEHVNSGKHPLRSCGQGTWSSNSSREVVDSGGTLIGHVSFLTYKFKKSEGGGKGLTTHCVMHEFHLPDPPQSSQPPPEVTTTTKKKGRRQQQRGPGKLVLCRIRYHKTTDEGGSPQKRGLVEGDVSHSKRGCVGLDQQVQVDEQQPFPSVEELHGSLPQESCSLQQPVPSVEEFDGGSCGDLLPETHYLQHLSSLLLSGSGSPSDVRLPEQSVSPPQRPSILPSPLEDFGLPEPEPEPEHPLPEPPVFTGQQRPSDDVPTTIGLGQEQDTAIFEKKKEKQQQQQHVLFPDVPRRKRTFVRRAGPGAPDRRCSPQLPSPSSAVFPYLAVPRRKRTPSRRVRVNAQGSSPIPSPSGTDCSSITRWPLFCESIPLSEYIIPGDIVDFEEEEVFSVGDLMEFLALDGLDGEEPPSA